MEYEHNGNRSLQEGQWFCHLAVDNPGTYRGQSIQYVFEVSLFSYEEIECEGDVCPSRRRL